MLGFRKENIEWNIEGTQHVWAPFPIFPTLFFSWIPFLKPCNWDWGLNPHVYDPKLWSITLEVEPGKVGAHSFDSETHVFSPPENRLHCIINGVSRLLLAWWQVTHLSLPGAFWQGFFFFLKCQCQTLKNECLLEIKSQRLWWNTLLRNVISPKLLMSQKMIVYEKHKHQWLWVEKRLTKVKFRRQRCYGITWEGRS